VYLVSDSNSLLRVIRTASGQTTLRIELVDATLLFQAPIPNSTKKPTVGTPQFVCPPD
jgi:hypothetical protein